jgi:hypothetical protein
MSNFFEIRPAIHFPIDVQCKFCNCLSEKRSKEFPRRIADFSNELGKLGVETFPVADTTILVDYGYYEKPFPEVVSTLTKNTKKNFFRALSFGPDFFPDTSNAVFVKDVPNAFAFGPLSYLVKERRIKTVIITGMNTTECVAQTVMGAFYKCREDVCIKVVYDLLADGFDTSIKPEDNPLSHKAAIEKEILSALAQKNGKRSPRLSLVNATQVLKCFS